MGVKSTVYLTRREAEERYVDLRFEEIRRYLRAETVLQSNEELEIALERLNDAAKGGEGFENYTIEAD